MFKISSYALTVALLAGGGSRAAAQTCPSVISSFTGECNYDNFQGGLDASCDVTEIFPGPQTAADGCPANGNAPATTCAEPTEKFAFGCCAGTINVDLACTRPGCVEDEFLNFYQAKAHCEAEGLRLCTAAELGADACCSQGCGFDSELTWTAAADSASCDADYDPADEVAELCAYDAPVHFVEAQGTYQKDRRYFAGGGILSDGQPDHFDYDMANLMRFDTNRHGKSVIAFPQYAARFEYNIENGNGENGYPANMNLETSCGLNTIMCCYADGDEAFPDGQTTDVCYHDLHDSPQSNHIKEGWSIFDSGAQPYCVGFTWEDEDDQEELLGNILYDISIHNTLDKGYIHSVPGAPMCGCVEHMPAVEEASCRTATKSGDTEFVFKYDTIRGYVTADNFADISFAPCTNADLAAQFKSTKATDDEKALIDEHLVGVGNCATETEEYLNADQFLLQRQVDSRYITPDAGWSPLVVGEGILFQPPSDTDPEVSDTLFRNLIEAGCTSTDVNGTVVDRYCIVRRVCPSCNSDDHRDIYYQRYTELPPFGTNSSNYEMYLLDMFMNNWVSRNNTKGVDFDLFSSYEQALEGEDAWVYCNYNHGNIGFPRDCGPRGAVGNQWNSFTRGGGAANDHGWYVELPSSAAR
jgi:hypothetical protein